MEREDNGDGDDGHVDGEAEVGEVCAFVGAVVASVAGLVVEKERAPPWLREEDGALGAVHMFRWCPFLLGAQLTGSRHMF